VPFKSEAQRKFLFARHPEIAKRWQDETPARANLPEHVKKVTETARKVKKHRGKL
jgi:hypothetical protein